jgi:hypothetical protein
MSPKYILNPNMVAAYQDSTCKLTLEGNEFEINFTDFAVKENVTKILSGDFSVISATSMPDFINFLGEQHLLFEVPQFTSRPDTKKPCRNVV